MKQFYNLLAVIMLAIVTPLLGMDKIKQVERITDENETHYNQEDCRPFVTLTVLQTAPRFYSLENYVNQLTNNADHTVKTNMGMYQLINPEKWHMSLITLALPYTDRLMRLSKSEVNKGMFIAETRRYADQALEDLARIAARHAKRLKGIEFKYQSIGGIGTNKFIVGYFGFDTAADRNLYHQVYADIIADFLNENKDYAKTWMRYGFEFLPHVSVLKKYFGPEGSTAAQGEVCKGSGRGTKKAEIAIAPAAPIIQNMELLFNNRYIIVSAKSKGYPLAPEHPRAQEYKRNGELAVEANGKVHEIKK